MHEQVTGITEQLHGRTLIKKPLRRETTEWVGTLKCVVDNVPPEDKGYGAFRKR